MIPSKEQVHVSLQGALNSMLFALLFLIAKALPNTCKTLVRSTQTSPHVSNTFQIVYYKKSCPQRKDSLPDPKLCWAWVLDNKGVVARRAEEALVHRVGHAHQHQHQCRHCHECHPPRNHETLCGCLVLAAAGFRCGRRGCRLQLPIGEQITQARHTGVVSATPAASQEEGREDS